MEGEKKGVILQWRILINTALSQMIKVNINSDVLLIICTLDMMR